MRTIIKFNGTKLALLAGVVTALLAWSIPGRADDEEKGEHNEHHHDEDSPIEHIMEKAHKGKHSLVAKVRKGEGTDEDLKQLIGYYIQLEKLHPPKGPEKSWEKKTKELTRSAIYLFAKREGSMERFKKAVNCKACHKIHRKDEDEH